MPSGSYVDVFVNTWRGDRFLNIYVHPLRVDAYHTEGLCGNYNLDRNDDPPPSCRANCEDFRHELILITYFSYLF